MKILVILAHPDPRSFNHAIAKTVVEQIEANGHRALFHENKRTAALARRDAQ